MEFGENFLKSDQDHINALTNHPVLPSKEQLGLLRKYREEGCTDSRDMLVTHNMRMVVSNVKKFKSNTKDPKFMDLISVGVVGLLKAIEKFDLDRPNVFSTYAVWWICAEIRNELKFHDNRVLRFKAIHAEFKAMEADIFRETHSMPSNEQVFEALGWDEKNIQKFINTRDKQLVSLDQVDSDDLYEQSNAPIQEESTADVVLDPWIDTEDKGSMDLALSMLDPTSRDVISSHFGLGNRKSETYDELAERLGRTREAVRQIENDGLRLMMLYLVSATESDF